MKKFFAMLTLTVIFAQTSLVKAQAINKTDQKTPIVNSQVQPRVLLPAQPIIAKPIPKPAYKTIAGETTILELLVKSMKEDGVYTKSTERYLVEFNKILNKYPKGLKRSQSFIALDKKFPNTSKLVKKYFDKLNNQAPVTPPVIYDVPPKPSTEFIALLKEMELFVLDVQKVKIKLERLEKKLDDMRR